MAVKVDLPSGASAVPFHMIALIPHPDASTTRAFDDVRPDFATRRDRRYCACTTIEMRAQSAIGRACVPRLRPFSISICNPACLLPPPLPGRCAYASCAEIADQAGGTMSNFPSTLFSQQGEAAGRLLHHQARGSESSCAARFFPFLCRWIWEPNTM